MTTIVNNPASNTEPGNNLTLVTAMVLIIGAITLFLLYGLPTIRESFENRYENNSQMGPQAPQINVPDTIDVNINQPQQ